MLFQTSQKIWLHIDCDSFFASAEIVKNPALKGKFVCVGSEIIVACTYNCKALGIKTGTPIWEAERMLKGKGVFLKPSMEYYAELSYRLFGYLESQVIDTEVFSIDEAFCEITGIPEYYGISLETYLLRLQHDVLAKFGIPVSIGCAETRLKAKMYSKLNKPFGIYIGFDAEREKVLFSSLPVGKIPFIGRRYQERLKYQAKSVRDFLQIGFWNLKRDIGKPATDLWLELRGVNMMSFARTKAIQSSSRSRSFNHEINHDPLFLKRELHTHFESVWEEVMGKSFMVRKVALMLRTREFQTLYYTLDFPDYTNHRATVYHGLCEMFEKYFDVRQDYRSVGVVLSDFRSFLPQQQSLFEFQAHTQEQHYQLSKTIEKINKKLGKHVLTFGTEWLGKKMALVPKEAKRIF